MPLTDVAIRKLQTPPRPVKKFDAGGLYLHLQPTGSKIWRMSYRFAGKQNTISFGRYPDVTLGDARKQRDAAKELIEVGYDPVVKRQQERERAMFAAANTFEEIGREWQEKRLKEDLSHSARRKDTQMLNHHAYPALGSRRIVEITAPEILALIRRVEAKGATETAHRLRGTISRVFRYAIATGRAERDPAAALVGALVAHNTTHHAALFEPKAIGGLMRAIEGYDAAVTRAALKLQVHTFVRPSELRLAEWTEFDLDGALWTIPEGRMKMARKHLVPLSPQVVAVLRELHTITGEGRYLFPSMLGGRRPMSDATVNAALRRMGYTKDQVVGHGFRRTASTILNESGLFNSDAIERQLAHVDGGVRGIYNAAEYLPERTRMMTWYSEWLDAQRDQR